MYTQHLTPAELERTCYSLGALDAAKFLGQIADLETENAEYETKLDDAPDPDEFKKLETRIEAFEVVMNEARQRLDDLYTAVHDGKPTKAELKALVLAVDLTAPE